MTREEDFRDHLRQVGDSGEAGRQEQAYLREQQRVAAWQEWHARERLQPEIVQLVADAAAGFAVVMAERGQRPDMSVSHMRWYVERRRVEVDRLLGIIPIHQTSSWEAKRPEKSHPVWLVAFSSLEYDRDVDMKRERHVGAPKEHTFYTKGLAIDANGTLLELKSAHSIGKYGSALMSNDYGSYGSHVQHPVKAVELVNTLQLWPTEAMSQKIGVREGEVRDYVLYVRGGGSGWPMDVSSKVSRVTVSSWLPKPEGLEVVGQPSWETLAPLAAIDSDATDIEQQSIVGAFRARLAEMAYLGGS